MAETLASNWKHARLDEACDVILGQSPPGNTYNTVGDGLPFFQGKAEFGEMYPTAVKWCSAPTKIAEAEDVLISVRAPVGPTNLCPSKACIGRGLAAIRPKHGTPPRYVLYALRATVAALAEQATGTTFEAVNGSDLRAHKIPLAPPNEQARIVAEIEKQFTRLDAGGGRCGGCRPTSNATAPPSSKPPAKASFLKSRFPLPLLRWIKDGVQNARARHRKATKFGR